MRLPRRRSKCTPRLVESRTYRSLTTQSAVPPCQRRTALGLEYDGSAYAGWQTQESNPSVQLVAQQAFAAVADHPIALTVAGRTDAGVHALEQVVHFDASATRSARAWVYGANANLPPDVSALWAERGARGFPCALLGRVAHLSLRDSQPRHAPRAFPAAGVLDPRDARSRAHARLLPPFSWANTTSRRSVPRSVKRARRSGAWKRSRSVAGATTSPSRSAPTLSCITWCATSPEC